MEEIEILQIARAWNASNNNCENKIEKYWESKHINHGAWMYKIL